MRFVGMCSLVAIPLVAGLAWAVDLAQVKVNYEGNERKGQYLYQKNCREACHDGSGANELSPMDKTYAEWKAAVASLSTLPCADKFRAKVSEADVNDIFSYLHNGAKDSPNPTK